jgi:hypothetical protein
MAVKRSECRRSMTELAHRAPRGWIVNSGDAVAAMHIIIPKMVSSPRSSEMMMHGVAWWKALSPGEGFA